MRLQLRFSAANTTRIVARNNFFGPLFSIPNMAKRFLRLAIDEVGIALSPIALGNDAPLTATPFAFARTRRAKAIAVIAASELCAANPTRLRLNHRPEQRLVNPEQRAFKTPNSARVAAQILRRLRVSGKDARRHRKHRVHLIAAFISTKSFLADSDSAPIAVDTF